MASTTCQSCGQVAANVRVGGALLCLSCRADLFASRTLVRGESPEVPELVREESRKARALARKALADGSLVERAKREWDMSTPECQAAMDLLMERSREAWQRPFSTPEFRIAPVPEGAREAEWLLAQEPTVITSREGGLAHSFLGAEITAEEDENFDPFWYARPVDEGAVSVTVDSDRPYHIDRVLPGDWLAVEAEEERVAKMYARSGEFPEAGPVTITKGRRVWRRPAQESQVHPHSTLSRDVPNPHTIPEGSFSETLFSERILEATAWVALGAYQTTKNGVPAIRLGTMVAWTTDEGHVRAECGKCGTGITYRDADARERMVRAWYETLAQYEEDAPERGVMALEAAYEARHDFQGQFTSFFIRHGYDCQYEAQKARPSGYARTVEPDGSVKFHVTDRVYVGSEPQPALPNEPVAYTFLGESRTRPLVGSEWERTVAMPVAEIKFVQPVTESVSVSDTQFWVE